MKLSDIMSAADLAVYAEVGLILFLIAFLLVVVKVLVTRSSTYDRVLHLPFESEPARNSVNPKLENER